MADLLEVQPDLLAAEEILRPNLLELTDLGPSTEELVERRHRPEGYTARPAPIENPTTLLAHGRRDRDQDRLGVQSAAELRDLAYRARHRAAVPAAASDD